MNEFKKEAEKKAKEYSIQLGRTVHPSYGQGSSQKFGDVEVYFTNSDGSLAKDCESYTVNCATIIFKNVTICGFAFDKFGEDGDIYSVGVLTQYDNDFKLVKLNTSKFNVAKSITSYSQTNFKADIELIRIRDIYYLVRII